MAKKDYGSKLTKEGDVEFTTEAWNTAEGFVKLKILRLLIQLDKYETLSQYGVEEIGDEAFYSPNDIAKRRKDSMYRFCSCLRQLLSNTKFALKKQDIIFVDAIMNRVSNVEKFIPDLITSKANMITQEIEILINEDHFSTCFGILQRIKEEINTPLNKAGLIFKESDEMDIDAIMRDIVTGG